MHGMKNRAGAQPLLRVATISHEWQVVCATAHVLLFNLLFCYFSYSEVLFLVLWWAWIVTVAVTGSNFFIAAMHFRV